MQNVEEGGENSGKKENMINFADFSDEEIKEKFG